MYKNHKIVVFATEHYNTLGLIRSLGEAGLEPDYIAVKGKACVASTSKYINDLYKVETIDEGYDLLLKKYGHEKEDEKPLVLAMEDKVILALDENYDELKDKFIFFSSGKKNRTLEYMDKFKILELAKKHGLKTLDTVVVNKGEIPDNLIYPVITKSISPVEGGWKSDVFICENKFELEAAFENIKSDRVVIQKFINKKNEYCLDGMSYNRGNDVFIAVESTYNYLIKGYYSPYMTVCPFENQEMQQALSNMMKEIGFDGIYSIEFLIDEDNQFYFSEINFRHSTWGYAATVAGMNLPKLWVEAMVDGEIPDNSKNEFEPFTAMVEPIDYQKRVVERQLNIKEWLVDLAYCKCPFYYNTDDIEPYIEMIKNNEKLK